MLSITSKVTGKMPLLGYEIDGEMNLMKFPESGLPLRVESIWKVVSLVRSTFEESNAVHEEPEEHWKKELPSSFQTKVEAS